jgi:hypothetical protein
MTLKEKFRKAFGLPRITDYGCKLMEKVADEFAIGFAEWLDRLRVIDNAVYSYNSYTELLEIYKKEKGL